MKNDMPVFLQQGNRKAAAKPRPSFRAAAFPPSWFRFVWVQERKGHSLKPTQRIFVLALVLLVLLPNANRAAFAEGVLALPKALRIIEEEAFFGASSIDRVVLSDDVTEIRARAFANSALSQIHLPDSITFIDPTAFSGTLGLTVTANPGSYAYRWAEKRGYFSVPSIPLLNEPIVSGDTIFISWSNADNASAYTVFYGTSPSVFDAAAVSVGSNTRYTISGLSPCTAYSLWVTAANADGQTSRSLRASAVTGVDPSTQSVEQRLTAELSAAMAKAKQLSGDTNYNGLCGRCTGYQLYALGIFDRYIGCNGNRAYTVFKDLNASSGVARTLYPGVYQGGTYTITQILHLLDAANTDGHQQYTIFGFHTGTASLAGQTYGHVLLVHAVYQGKVYWCESFGKETRVATIADFASTYAQSGTVFQFDGAIAYGNPAGR